MSDLAIKEFQCAAVKAVAGALVFANLAAFGVQTLCDGIDPSLYGESKRSALAGSMGAYGYGAGPQRVIGTLTAPGAWASRQILSAFNQLNLG